MRLMTIIPTAGRPELLATTVASLAECQHPDDYAGTLVVENGGRNGAEAVVRSAPPSLGCQYHFHPNGNKSEALNSVLPMAGDALVFFADDDVRFSRETLVAYASAGGRGPGHFFGGPTGVDYEVEPAEWLKRYLPLSARGWIASPEQRQSVNLSFLGFNWAAFAGDIRAAGGFDTRRGPGSPTGGTGQEGEMQARLRRAGATPVYVPQAWVWHYIPAERCSAEWIIDRAYRHGVSYAMDRGGGGGGLPAWVAARLVKGMIRRAVATMAFSPVLRLDARARQSYNRGLLAGFRLRREMAG